MLLNFNTLKTQTGDIAEIKATGGGATSDVWLQIKADILNTEITALSCKEVGAAGTTALAGVCVKCFDNLKDAVYNMVKIRKVFAPNEKNSEAYASLYNKYANLYNAVKGL
jgi:xylulokinase